MTKRSFFKSVMGAVAAVALAPEIAFGVKLKMPVPERYLWWMLDHTFRVLKLTASEEEAAKAAFKMRLQIMENGEPDFENPYTPYSEFKELRRKAGLAV